MHQPPLPAKLEPGFVSAVSAQVSGSGSAPMTEEELKELELGVVGAICEGCYHAESKAVWPAFAGRKHSPQSSFICRVNGMKERDARRNIRFYPSRHLPPRQHCWQRHTRTGAVWWETLCRRWAISINALRSLNRSRASLHVELPAAKLFRPEKCRDEKIATQLKSVRCDV